MRRLYASSLACALFAIGCGSSTAQTSTAASLDEAPAPLGPANARGDEEARARVGAAGGTFALANGARLSIPSGALTQEVEVVLAVGTQCRAFADAERQRPLSAVFSVSPGLSSNGDEMEFSVPQQPIPGGYSPEDLAFAIEMADDGARAIDTLATETRWQMLPVRVENGRFIARTHTLPGMRVQFGVAR